MFFDSSSITGLSFIPSHDPSAVLSTGWSTPAARARRSAVEDGVGEAVTSPAVPTESATRLWEDFLSDAGSELFRMSDAAVRDQPLDVCQAARAVTIELDHPEDEIALSCIPDGVTVEFLPLAPIISGEDRRDIQLLSELKQSSPLPATSVVAAPLPDGGERYLVTRAGGGTAIFNFATGVTCPARRQLQLLQEQAEIAQAQFVALREQVQADPALLFVTSAQREALARIWEAVDESIKARVLSFFRPGMQGRFDAAQVSTLLRDGDKTYKHQMASQIVTSAMMYWINRDWTETISQSFWIESMTEQAPVSPSAESFVAAVMMVKQTSSIWREEERNLHSWLGEYPTSAPPLDAFKRALALTAVEGQGDNTTPPETQFLVDSMEHTTIRGWLSRAHGELLRSELPASNEHFQQLLKQWNDRFEGCAITLYAQDAVDFSRVKAEAVTQSSGNSVARYVLPSTLPASVIRTMFVLPSELLSTGGTPLQSIARYDDDFNAIHTWSRTYRFSEATLRDDSTGESSQRCYDMQISGMNADQRRELDAYFDSHIDVLSTLERQHASQDGVEQITMRPNRVLSLAQTNDQTRIKVRFEGPGGLLQLPSNLRGSIVVDFADVAAGGAHPIIWLEPGLANRLCYAGDRLSDGNWFSAFYLPAESTSVTDADTFDDMAMRLLIGPYSNKAGRSVIQTLMTQLDTAARNMLAANLADPAVSSLHTGPNIRGKVVIPVINRNLEIIVDGNDQQIDVAEIGAGLLVIRLKPARFFETTRHAVAASLSLPSERLPHYATTLMEAGRGKEFVGGLERLDLRGSVALFVDGNVHADLSAWNDTQMLVDTEIRQFYLRMLNWAGLVIGGRPLDASAQRQLLQYRDDFNEADCAWATRIAQVFQTGSSTSSSASSTTLNGTSLTTSDPAILLPYLALYLCGNLIKDVGDDALRAKLRERNLNSFSAVSVFSVVLDVIWHRRGYNDIFTRLAGIYRYQAMAVEGADDRLAKLADCQLVETALRLIQRLPVTDSDLHGSGLSWFKDDPDRIFVLQVIFTAYATENLLSDDSDTRNDFVALLRNTNLRHRRVATMGMISTSYLREGHESKESVEEEWKMSKGVLLMKDICVDASAAPSCTIPRTVRSTSTTCTEQTAPNVIGASLIFIGDVGTACANWVLHEGGQEVNARKVSMMFQMVKGMGWITQGMSLRGCVGTGVQAYVPETSTGMGALYIIGALFEGTMGVSSQVQTGIDLLRAHGVDLTSLHKPPSVLHWLDAAGNAYLLIGDVATLRTQWIERNVTQSGKWFVSVTATMSSLAGTVAASGEIGLKPGLAPRQDLMAAFNVGSAAFNLCSEAADKARRVLNQDREL